MSTVTITLEHYQDIYTKATAMDLIWIDDGQEDALRDDEEYTDLKNMNSSEFVEAYDLEVTG